MWGAIFNALCLLRCLILVHFKYIAAGCLVSCTVNLRLQLSCGNLFAVSYVCADFLVIFFFFRVCGCVYVCSRMPVVLV